MTSGDKSYIKDREICGNRMRTVESNAIFWLLQFPPDLSRVADRYERLPAGVSRFYVTDLIENKLKFLINVKI